MKLRFFAEEGADVCVWGEVENADQIQHDLPIPSDLAADMAAWIAEFNKRTQENDPGPWTARLREEHDRRGYELSRRLQEVLGPEHEVIYTFTTSAVRTSADLPAAPSAPAPEPSRVVELVRAIALLALPAADQLDWAASRGGPISPDALVIDLYEMVDQVPSFGASGWIGPRAAERIGDVARAVEALSGQGNPDAWSAAGLREAPEWEGIRDLARRVLAVL